MFDSRSGLGLQTGKRVFRDRHEIINRERANKKGFISRSSSV